MWNNYRSVVYTTVSFDHVSFPPSLVGPLHVTPSELLPVDGDSWEEEVSSLIHNQLLPMGFELQAFTRVPYLCEGDSTQEYYTLDDVVIALRKPLTRPDTHTDITRCL